MANWKMQERDRIRASRGLEQDYAEFEHDCNDPTASPTTPLAFCSPGRRQASYVRSHSMNGRIQKPSFVRSQSFNGSKCTKLGPRSHHMESLQAQLFNYMKATGMDQQKVVHVLEKLKETYISRSEQQNQLQDQSILQSSRPSSPCNTPAANQPTHRLENAPVEASTIALLKQKFAQLERYKESIQGQQIQLYPGQNFHGQSSSQSTPVSSTPCSPRVGTNGIYYPVDEGTGSILQQQQDMPSSNSGICDDAPKETQGSRSPTYDSSASSSVSSKGDEAANALLHYMLQPPNAYQQNLAAFQKMDLSGVTSTGSGNEPSTEKVEPPVRRKPMPDIVALETHFTSSIQRAMAKYPFCLTAKVSSPKLKLPAEWGTGLSLHSPVSPASDSSGGWEGELCELGRKEPDVQSCSSGAESSDEMYIDDCKELDTSLHL